MSADDHFPILSKDIPEIVGGQGRS